MTKRNEEEALKGALNFRHSLIGSGRYSEHSSSVFVANHTNLPLGKYKKLLHKDDCLCQT